MTTKIGDSGDDVLRGTSDPDALVGLGGDDVLLGRSDGDILAGDEGDDTLLGGGGDDVLLGGSGDDLLSGGTADNTFVFGPNNGEDIIPDFWNGDDNKIDVTAYNILSFADLDIDTDLSGITLDFGESIGASPDVNTVTLVGVYDLDASDFLFAA